MNGAGFHTAIQWPTSPELPGPCSFCIALKSCPIIDDSKFHIKFIDQSVIQDTVLFRAYTERAMRRPFAPSDPG
jgi:hypothetical protein